MLLEDIGHPRIRLNSEQLIQLRVNCSEFLYESCNNPALITLVHRDPFTKIKVRHKSRESFNLLKYTMGWNNRSDRTIVKSYQTGNYWLFPSNGYSYTYSTTISNFESYTPSLISNTDDMDLTTEVIGDSYKSHDLAIGLQSADEIIWHSMPYYFAVDCSLFQNYGELLNII